ncbi:facilitated trehalose transporter Tret1-like [Microplitis mediator]|uniref:facilitated trehalose transporter Tret1-like n=1 Tax=Microplitis mediator TaxID=375433 RepID=UPI0025559CAE|nr:facilitated trehalose transporter Tret1-like [Microplitis mediator]
MSGGAAFVWSSPTLLMLREDPINEKNPLGRPISAEEASWVESLTSMGVLAGCLFPGYLAGKWGRRATLLSSIVPYLLGWSLVGAGRCIEVLYAGRFILGLATSIAFAVIPIYCGEIAEPSIRGILGALFQVSITLGELWAFCIGPYVSYVSLCIACAALPIAFFISFYIMPESPYYLAAKDRNEDVVRVLTSLRGKSEDDVQIEADEIEVLIHTINFNVYNLMNPFYVSLGSGTTKLLISGIAVVVGYLEVIFASAGNTGMSSALEAIIVGVVQLLSSCINPLVVDRLGRRGALGLFFYLRDAAKSDVSGIGWLPLTALITYIASYSVGLGPIPWTITGEMFSPEIKSTASGITVFTCCFMAMMMSKYFISIATAFGHYTAFWFFGSFSLLSVFFTVFILPETKGKSLQEIQNELAGKARNI